MSLDWLTARPIAHRGLHDAQRGIIENTATAFAAAISGSYGIETDLQISADGEAMVHHDDALGRLTEGAGRLAEVSTAQLKSIQFKATADRILTLGELLDLVAGRATLLLELKSHFNGDTRLLTRAADVLSAYRGPAALMSFDPELIELARSRYPALVRGIVAQRHYSRSEWKELPASAQTEHGPSVARPAEPSPIHRLFCPGFTGWAAAADACSVEIAIADVDSAQRQGSKAGCSLGRPGHI